MKYNKIIQIVTAGLLLACNTLMSYTWTIHNQTGEALKNVEVCTTPGINHCQNKDTVASEEPFSFTSWYNKGLCLSTVKINDKKVNLNPKSAYIAASVAGVLSGAIGLGVAAIAFRCGSKDLYIFKDKDGNYYSGALKTNKVETTEAQPAEIDIHDAAPVEPRPQNLNQKKGNLKIDF